MFAVGKCGEPYCFLGIFKKSDANCHNCYKNKLFDLSSELIQQIGSKRRISFEIYSIILVVDAQIMHIIFFF